MSRRDRPPASHSDSECDSEGSDVEEFVHIQCWIPSANIDLAALAAYLKDYIDDTATIRPSPNPNDAARAGYTITAKKTLNMDQVRDIIEDSRAWEKEKLTREYRRDPYGYHESDAWEKRKRTGASVSDPKPRRRRRRSPSAATSPPPPPATQIPLRHGSIDGDISYRRNTQDGLPVGAAARVATQRQTPSNVAVTEPRYAASSDKDKERAQYSLRVMQPTISNMSKAVAKDRHRDD